VTDAGTREAPGEWDALPKLREGEPYFGLIGRDRLAPPLIVEWADRNRRRAMEDHDAGRITTDQLHDELRKSTNAEMVAADMQAYKNGWKPQHPEQLQRAGERNSYSGADLPPETRLSDRVQRLRVRTSSALNEAVAALSVFAAEFTELSLKEEARRIEAAAARLASVKKAVEPKRPILRRTKK
jgi:hypothetical protein